MDSRKSDEAKVKRKLGKPDSTQAKLRGALADRDELKRQLLHAQKMGAVGTLAGGMAHDFNNLLTSILSSSQMVLDQPLVPDHVMRSAARIKTAAQRASALTAQLMTFSRKRVHRPVDLSLNDAICEARELFSCMLPGNIELELDLDREAGCVHFDPGQFEQMIINLVVNARDAMPEGGTLRLRTVATSLDEQGAARVGLAAGRYALLSITDTGVGIPRENLRLIFDPFFTTKEAGQGTGLGLSTVHCIVESHGGVVSFDSKLGRGTTFWILLPGQKQAPRTGELHPVVRDHPPCVGERTLLVVEDDGLARDLVREVLEEAGFHVMTAESPRAALDLIEQRGGRIHLLVTDVVLPQMSGFALAKLLQDQADRVLFMSGYADQVLADQGRPALQSEFIRKPFANDELVAKVWDLLAPRIEARAASPS